MTVLLPARERLDPGSLMWGFLVILLLVAAGTLGLWLMDARAETEALRRDAMAVENQHLQEREQSSRLQRELERQLAEKTAELATLETERRAQEALTVTPPRTVSPPQLRVPSRPAPIAAPEPPMANAIPVQATPAVVASPAEPETLPPHMVPRKRVPADPGGESVRKEDEPKRSRLTRWFTNRIFIDSVVLGGSLLVPPSLPMTLAQSRLGRSLTQRVMKKTHLDKTVGGKVAQDMGNMPITRKRRK